ncbi:MAG TPA: hypothetical protein VFC94_03190 [Bacteroidaceae bacterium]|nr:hypothetical protein [Bacteroidaceae bacterium]
MKILRGLSIVLAKMLPTAMVAALLLLTAMVTSCGQRHERWAPVCIGKLLDRAQTLMNDNVGKVYFELAAIDSHDLRIDRQRACYALLFIQAQYKYFIDETSDSLINIAVNYYSTSRDTHNEFLSYYYQGCIYMNPREYSKAALSLARAEQLLGNIDDLFQTGQLYLALGELNELNFDFIKAKKCRSMLVFTIIAALLLIVVLYAYYRYKQRKTMDIIKENIASIQQLSQSVQNKNSRIKELNTQINILFSHQYSSLDSMCVAFYDTIDELKSQKCLYGRIRSEIISLMSPQNVEQMDSLINSAYNGIMDKIVGMGFSDLACNVMRLSLVGYSAKSISLLLNVTSQNVYQIKSRTMKRIRKIDQETTWFFLSTCK